MYSYNFRYWDDILKLIHMSDKSKLKKKKLKRKVLLVYTFTVSSSLVSCFWIFVTFDTVNFNTALFLFPSVCFCHLFMCFSVWIHHLRVPWPYKRRVTSEDISLMNASCVFLIILWHTTCKENTLCVWSSQHMSSIIKAVFQALSKFLLFYLHPCSQATIKHRLKHNFSISVRFVYSFYIILKCF